MRICNIKKIYKILVIVLTINILLLNSCVRLDHPYDGRDFSSSIYTTQDKNFAKGFAYEIQVPSSNENIPISNISADSYYFACVNKNNDTLTRYKNPYKKVPIASITKIMTALVVLKNCKNLNDIYHVSSNAVDLEKNASKANLKTGDRLSVKDLLYGLLLPSGNDAATVLAENLDGNYNNFILLMNNEANKLGALHTHFANPHGLDSEYHYSTSYDLFLIMKELLKYPLFKEITTTQKYESKILQLDGTYRTESWLNTNFFVMGDLSVTDNVNLSSGKTGFTSVAGNCLATSCISKKTGFEYISIILNASNKNNTYRNTNTLYNLIDK